MRVSPAMQPSKDVTRDARLEHAARLDDRRAKRLSHHLAVQGSQPVVERGREPSFCAARLNRDHPGGNLAQDAFAGRHAHLVMRRHAHGQLDQPIVEERRAHFQRVLHAHRVRRTQQLVCQICLQVDVEQAVQRVAALGPLRRFSSASTGPSRSTVARTSRASRSARSGAGVWCSSVRATRASGTSSAIAEARRRRAPRAPVERRGSRWRARARGKPIEVVEQRDDDVGRIGGEELVGTDA